MATPEQNNKFVADFNSGALDTAICWIRENLNPEDVFMDDDLIKWAEGYGMKMPDVEIED
jgi:hypothetical protein